MQISVPEVIDISRESQQTLNEYGAQPGAAFGNNCLLACRLVEQGVRFVQLFDWGWDFHGTNPGVDNRDRLTTKCRGTDQAVAALIRDLKQPGRLDETLVVFTGEFGRTPFREGRTARGDILGREYLPDCYAMLLCGGGIRRRLSYGQSDKLGFRPAEKQGPCPRLTGNLTPLAGPRSRTHHLPLSRTRFSTHRCAWQRRQGIDRMAPAHANSDATSAVRPFLRWMHRVLPFGWQGLRLGTVTHNVTGHQVDDVFRDVGR